MTKPTGEDPHLASLDADIAKKRKATIKLVAAGANEKPIIRIKQAEIDETISLAEKALALDGLHYVMGGAIVFVSTDPGTDTTLLKPTSPLALVRALSERTYFEQFDGRAKSYVLCDVPDRVAKVMAASETYKNMPVLQGLVRQPFFRSSGVLVTASGYDCPSQLYGVFNPAGFNIPPKPSRAVALRALAELQKLMTEFPFRTEEDASAAIAGCLTAAVRVSLPAAPMLMLVAPEAASGKGYLCRVMAAFASSSILSATAYPGNEEECGKLLLSLLMQSPAAILFDNSMTDLVPYGSMCSVLTEPLFTDRLLGINRTATVSTRSLFLATGNNIKPLKDLARRCLQIRIDPGVEKPAERSFKGAPLELVQRDRARYVSLALTVIKAYLVAGKPGLADLKPLSNYDDWTRMVRGPLVWLGLPDPAACIFTGLAEDPDRESLGRLLTAWHAVFADAPTSVRELMAAAELAGNVALLDALNEVAADRSGISRKRLGRWISRHEARVVGQLKIERCRKTSNSESWRVVGLSFKSDSFPPTRGNGKTVSIEGRKRTDLSDKPTKPDLAQDDDSEVF
jgi:hypothetical protein